MSIRIYVVNKPLVIEWGSSRSPFPLNCQIFPQDLGLNIRQIKFFIGCCLILDVLISFVLDISQVDSCQNGRNPRVLLEEGKSEKVVKNTG